MALPPMISVEDFFNPPTQTGATISPDGTRIAFPAPWQNRLDVWVHDLDSDDEPRCVIEMWHALTRFTGNQLGGRS